MGRRSFPFSKSALVFRARGIYRVLPAWTIRDSRTRRVPSSKTSPTSFRPRAKFYAPAKNAFPKIRAPLPHFLLFEIFWQVPWVNSTCWKRIHKFRTILLFRGNTNFLLGYKFLKREPQNEIEMKWSSELWYSQILKPVSALVIVCFSDVDFPLQTKNNRRF